MGYGMKYTKGGFPFKSSPAKVDLTKKTGLGPRAKVKKKNTEEIEKKAEEASMRVSEWHKYNPSVEGFVERELNPKKTSHDPLVNPDEEYGNIDRDQFDEANR